MWTDYYTLTDIQMTNHKSKMIPVKLANKVMKNYGMWSCETSCSGMVCSPYFARNNVLTYKIKIENERNVELSDVKYIKDYMGHRAIIFIKNIELCRSSFSLSISTDFCLSDTNNWCKVKFQCSKTNYIW